MSFVMDASVTASWCFPDETSPAADRAFARIGEESAVVPGHWWFELRNVLLVGERRGRVDATQIRRFLRLLAGLDIQTDPAPNEASVFNLARRHRLTIHDAAYLDLALRRGSIASLDMALVRAGEAEGIEIVR